MYRNVCFSFLLSAAKHLRWDEIHHVVCTACLAQIFELYELCISQKKQIFAKIKILPVIFAIAVLLQEGFTKCVIYSIGHKKFIAVVR